MTELRKHNVSEARKGPNLRDLDYSPDINPLIASEEVRVKRRTVRTVARQDMVNASTGEITGVAAIYSTEVFDEGQFVKVFAEGVKAAFALSRTAYRVFQLVLEAYQSTRMTGGYVDSVYLAWFDGGLSGQSVGMTDRTFQTGLKELLAKSFIAPRSPNLFWVNASLFFKGDRVAFVKEYRRRSAVRTLTNDINNYKIAGADEGNCPPEPDFERDPNTIDAFNGKTDLEN